MKWMLLLAPFLLAPNTNDQQFLNMITAMGITYNSPQDIIGYAHGVCFEMSQEAFPAIVSNIVHDYPKLPREAADTLATASITYYCPEYSKQIGDDRVNGVKVQ